MKNLFIIPTDKPSRLIHNDANELCYQSNKSSKNDRKWMYRKKFNIYITSDEEIKEGDWYITDGLLWKANRNIHLINSNKDKKIILTTDQDLIGVQPIDDEFLEWFVKNPSCKWVEINFSLASGSFKYKIIIPKQSTKDRILSETPDEVKQRVRDRADLLVNKEETLEEASERAVKSGLFKDKTLFIAGAKWQQEKIYNEIKELYDNENITGFSKLAYAKCLDIIKKK